MLQGNKGEWSEIYTFIKLLSDTEICIGDEKLNKVPALVYPIVKILRNEKHSLMEYCVEDRINIYKDSLLLCTCSIQKFAEISKKILADIKTKNKTFQIPEIESFLKEINCLSLKAKSSTKTDINLVVEDMNTKLQPLLGFSIKSQLGSPSTLLNAGKATNFIFKIDKKFTQQEIDHINNVSSKSKLKGRVQQLIEKKCNLDFQSVENITFQNNLILIDSFLPNIIAELLKLYYSTSISNLFELVEMVAENNPLKYDKKHSHKYYEYKIKKFLTEIALGIMPTKVWNGKYDATGGYLVVKDDGEILAYHVYNRNNFEDYLFQNTRLETASSSRHQFGEVYIEEDCCYLKLNLQIRFIK